MDVLKLTQARIDEGVVLMFVDSAGTFNLDAQQVIYLRDLGFSPALITAMLQHDLEIISGLRPVPPAPSASAPLIQFNFKPAEAAPKTDVAEPSTPPAAITASAEPRSIVNRPSPDITEDLDYWDSYEAAQADAAELNQRSVQAPAETPALTHLTAAISRVRQPYAVPLTDPILVIRGASPCPNLVRIQVLP
jgi:hypothetical protein